MNRSPRPWTSPARRSLTTGLSPAHGWRPNSGTNEMDSDLFQQASKIFLEARHLGPEERGALLVRRCGENAALRAQVELLLAGDEAPEPFDTLADKLHGIREV